MRRQYCFETILVGKVSLLKAGLAEILRSANFRILASVSCADDLPNREIQPCQQLFLIVHIGDDFDSSIEQIKLLRSRHPGERIAIVADRYRLDELVSAFRAGANGYFVDVMTSDVFITSLELVMMGETVLPAAFLSYVFVPEEGQTGGHCPGEADEFGPGGIPRGFRDLLRVLPMAQAGRGALIGRIGADGVAQPFLLGPSAEAVTPVGGA